VPPGFKVELFASGLKAPRALRVAPNGDIFVAETDAGRIRVLRAPDGANKPSETSVFVSGLGAPFGLAFYPPGPDPQWLYVAMTTSVVRFPYRAGDLRARGRAQTIVPRLPSGGHTTRDVVFSNDGARMFVSVGSATNAAEGMGERYPEGLLSFEKEHGLGASWGRDTDRAAVLAFDPDGRGRKTFATGIRNCVGLAVHPQTGEVWCSVNERDGLGDDLVPDFITRVREGGFYGWPWFYIGANPDPNHRGHRAELKDKITVPDVLIQAHSASLQLAFYTGTQFPAEYRGDAFAAEHGSWNRAKRTGYKMIRVKLKDGVPTGEYQDFLTGFVASDRAVWGRPVGVAVARDGSLLVSEDANGTIWMIRYQ
jgi:glucose/arabinose dehydrogenase